MIDLTLDLDTTDFETMFELGRSLIPAAAPVWTDHNTSDPGIMLLELAAWLADAEIYSLARLRHDERAAYARFAGVSANGPQPACALIWLTDPGAAAAPWAAGTNVTATTAALADVPNPVPFFLVNSAAFAWLQLSTARLIRVYSRFADDSTRDWTRINAQTGVTFWPFGSTPTRNDRLILNLSGPLVVLGDNAATAYVTVGFDIVRDTPDAVVFADTNVTGAARTGVAVSLGDSAGVRPIRVVADTTSGMVRSGVLVLEIDSRAAPVDASYALIFRPAGQTWLVPPQLRRVALNVLPMVQMQSITEELTFGTGLPDQTYTLKASGLVWSGSAVPVTVQLNEGGGWQTWSANNDLGSCDGSDRCFSFDGQAQLLSFGNGINGMMPPDKSVLRVTYDVTAATAGNMQANLSWSLPDLPDVSGTNTEATTGGADAESLDDLRASARTSVHQSRPYVTSGDLVQAVQAMADLDVARAVELPPAANSQRVLRGTRVLVVSRDSSTAREQPEWLEEIRARLAPKLPLGQLLRVIGPTYVDVGISATLVCLPNVDPVAVVAAAQAQLQAALGLSGGIGWPFGQEVTVLEVKGWLRNVSGVAKVAAVQLSQNGQAQAVTAALPATGLPVLVLGSITAQRWPGGGSS